MATTKSSSFTKAQLTQIRSIVKEVVAEELANSKVIEKTEKSEKKSNSSKKSFPAFNKLELKKNGKTYVVSPCGKLKNAFGRYNEDAEKFGGAYVKWDSESETGAWWKFTSKDKALKFIESRRDSYNSWVKEQLGTKKAYDEWLKKTYA